MLPKAVVITGPTATGKTALGIALSRLINGEVVGADSMQIYKQMSIGTAKPSSEELNGVPYHMLDVVSPFENYSVSRYVEDAAVCCDDILSRGKIPIIVGGTCLYIDSLLSGRSFAPESADLSLRRELSDMYDDRGGEYMLGLLADCDPESAAKLHVNDKKRIIRALEVFKTSGKSISEHNRESLNVSPRYDACKIALSFKNRQDLYNRIDKRVDVMLRLGLEREVRNLFSMGLPPSCTAMQAIGYKEMASYISGLQSLEEAVAAIKMESRRYAKRQLSWLRRDNSINWILWDASPNIESALHISTAFLEKSGII